MKERRVYKRFVKRGIFAVIAGTPYKIIDISLGGASFCYSGDLWVTADTSAMEILVMNGHIHYIQDIKHSYIEDSFLTPGLQGGDDSDRVSVAFQKLTAHQSAQFHMLLGVS